MFHNYFIVKLNHLTYKNFLQKKKKNYLSFEKKNYNKLFSKKGDDSMEKIYMYIY